jgi:hypothetical protein
MRFGTKATCFTTQSTADEILECEPDERRFFFHSGVFARGGEQIVINVERRSHA